MRERRPLSILAILLIVFGIVLAALNFVKLSGGGALIALGLVFVAVYVLAGRHFGFLVAACLVMGLGLGLYAQDLGVTRGASGAPILGLGGGFIALWSLDRRRRGWLTVGGVLVVVGVIVFAVTGDWTHGWQRILWPLILVALGVWLLVRRAVRR